MEQKKCENAPGRGELAEDMGVTVQGLPGHLQFYKLPKDQRDCDLCLPIYKADLLCFGQFCPVSKNYANSSPILSRWGIARFVTSRADYL